jgi:hypothetical protein
MQVEKVRGMADTSGLGKPTSLEGPAPKKSQEEAAYGDSTARCGTCKFYDENSGECSKVEGPIDPDGHSRFYEASESTETAEPDKDADDTE